MKISLAQLEARLQALIEGSVARLFPLEDLPPRTSDGVPWSKQSLSQDLASRLVDAMQSNVRPRTEGTFWAPNLYILLVHPTQVEALGANQAWLDDLALNLQQVGAENEVSFQSPPAIQVIPDPQAGIGDISIKALFDLDHHIDTTSLLNPHTGAGDAAPPGGFLIVDGSHVFPIEKPVVNIGRSSRNDLMIENPQVSREHAQLRLVHGRFLIFDLDSTGGTFVNGQRVIQSVLYPGDVISLAGVSMIFNQDSPSPTGETKPFPPE